MYANERGNTMARTLFDLWKTLKGLWLTGNGQMLLRESETIENDGVLLGAVVSHRLGVQFIASNDSVTDMDQSVWPTPEYARRAARQLFRSNASRTRSSRLAWTASGLSPKKIRTFSAAQ
jgi:hypothetical protein